MCKFIRYKSQDSAAVIGTEKLSDPLELFDSDKVTIIATNPLTPIKIGKGIKKTASKSSYKNCYFCYFL